jgi:hypothetical protein
MSPPSAPARDDVGHEIIDRLESLDYGSSHDPRELAEKFMRIHQTYSDAVDHFVPADPKEWTDAHRKLVSVHENYSNSLRNILNADDS